MIFPWGSGLGGMQALLQLLFFYKWIDCVAEDNDDDDDEIKNNFNQSMISQPFERVLV